MDNLENTNTAAESQDPRHKHGVEVVRSAALPRSFFRGNRPKGHRNGFEAAPDSASLSFEQLQGALRGEASIHATLLDESAPLDPDRLLKLSWLAAEVAAQLEERA